MFVVIISDGKIQVFTENQEEPLAVAVDTQGALPIKYFGFASYENSLVTFFYNCKGEIIYQKGITNDHPSLAKDELSSVDLRNCMF